MEATAVGTGDAWATKGGSYSGNVSVHNRPPIRESARPESSFRRTDGGCASSGWKSRRPPTTWSSSGRGVSSRGGDTRSARPPARRSSARVPSTRLARLNRCCCCRSRYIRDPLAPTAPAPRSRPSLAPVVPLTLGAFAFAGYVGAEDAGPHSAGLRGRHRGRGGGHRRDAPRQRHDSRDAKAGNVAQESRHRLYRSGLPAQDSIRFGLLAQPPGPLPSCPRGPVNTRDAYFDAFTGVKGDGNVTRSGT
jgi:hypothetical protein